MKKKIEGKRREDRERHGNSRRLVQAVVKDRGWSASDYKKASIIKLGCCYF